MSEADASSQSDKAADSVMQKENPSDKVERMSGKGGRHESMVYLGKNITIDSSKRLAQFDNGDSLAYAAADVRERTKKYFAIISDQGQLPRWRSADSYESLAEPSLLRLHDSGVVFWPENGKQQYAFVYLAAVGESLIPKEAKFSNLSWRQTEINKYLIAPMARILKTMSDRSFFHGSIRPDNIFLNGHNKNMPIVLGDCLSVFPNSSQSSLFLSVERASAEPFGRGSGTLADDIYAFGVSLALILRKSDEIEGLSDKEILQRKIEHGSYSAIVGVERFQTRYVELLRGLLSDDSSQRWGLDDIFAWLDGSRMTPPAMSRRKKANRPLSFCSKKYLFPDALAWELAENPIEAIKVIENGELAQWIEKAFNDKDLNESYLKALERANGSTSGNESTNFTITHVVLALNPMLPIFFKGRVFAYDGIGGLMARTRYDGGDLSVFQDALQQNIPDLAASMKNTAQNELLALIKSFDACRTILRQKMRGNSAEKCIYYLCSIAPCFSPNLKDYFVHDTASCLLSFEDLSAKGGQIAIYIDQHIMAFLSVHERRLIDRVMYDLNQPDKNTQIAGNLRFLAMLQKKTKISSLPAIAKVFLNSLDGVYKVYNNVKLRNQVIDGVKSEAEKGNLTGMSAILDNHVLRQRDSKAFELAKREYKLLRREYDQYNKNLANKNTYGVLNGQEAASLISWIIATAITVMSVFAFMSGYKIF